MFLHLFSGISLTMDQVCVTVLLLSLVVYEGNSLIDSFLCSGMYSEIMLKKLTRLLMRVLRGVLLILGENVSL